MLDRGALKLGLCFFSVAQMGTVVELLYATSVPPRIGISIDSMQWNDSSAVSVFSTDTRVSGRC